MSEQKIEMEFEGWFSRIFCTNCENSFDVERDITNGEEVTCDACGKSGRITGR